MPRYMMNMSSITKSRKAKHYIYRNLNCGGFSSKYRGIVTKRFGDEANRNGETGWVIDPEFRVSQKVSAKIKQTKQRQVHAYVVGRSVMTLNSDPPDVILGYPHLKYNPHTDSEFHSSDGSDLSDYDAVVFYDNRAYLVKRGTTVFEWMAKIANEVLEFVKQQKQARLLNN